ncbi:MAG: hypothetical protein ACRCU5_10305, partial [Rhizobiaceae bacterium]
EEGVIGSQSDSGFPASRIAILGAGIVAFAASGIVSGFAAAGALLAAGCGLMVAFFVMDGRAHANRLLPMGTGNPLRPAGVTLLMVFGLSAGTIAFVIYGPAFLFARLGLSPVQIGGILMMESIAWSLAALIVSGAPRKREAMLLQVGFIWVALSIAGLSYAIPHGPIWSVVLCAIGQGAGFGIAWTFVYRRAVELVDETDRERMASAISTVQRIGYAIGAAYVGFIANRSGFAEVDLAKDGARIAQTLFTWCLVPALIGLICMVRFVKLIRNTDRGQCHADLPTGD